MGRFEVISNAVQLIEFLYLKIIAVAGTLCLRNGHDLMFVYFENLCVRLLRQKQPKLFKIGAASSTLRMRSPHRPLTSQGTRNNSNRTSQNSA